MSQRVITFHYTLTNKEGKTLDSSKGAKPFSYIEGANQIVPGLEKELRSLNKGDKKKVDVLSAEAYGERNEEMVLKVPREKLPSQGIKVGDQFRGGDDPYAPIFTVIGTADTEVTLDGNHPLAGVDLIFDVEIIDVRSATSEELDHGHAHGEHGESH